MPGPEMAYPDQGPDLYPQDESEHAALLGWCMEAWTAAEAAKRTRDDKMRKYHRIYRSWVDRTGTSQTWRSAVFVPYAFSTIESITPRMVAQLPRFVCDPVGPEDVLPAKLMEGELTRDAEQTDLYVELIKAIKTSLKYGTGILKNFYKQDVRRAFEARPKMEPVEVPVESVMTDDSGQEVVDLEGNPQVATETTIEMQPVLDEMGQPVMEWVPYEYLVYAGPASCWVDPFQFFIAPEANDIQSARYTIERFHRDVPHVQKMIDSGVYRLPPGKTTIEECFPDEETTRIRADEIEDDIAVGYDATRKAVELFEYHTDDGRIITVMNQTTILRVQSNPYWHGQKPYVDFPDYLQEGEFWGVGEVEAIEGLQDLLNALYNQRIDNVRLTMDAMFAVNAKALEDERDLVLRPGGIIRVTGDYLPDEAISRLDFGDVTGSAFAEADQIERLIERVSGVSAYQLGTSDEGMNRTATGVSLITAAGDSKFALKVRLMEMMGMARLAQQWGSIIQQYTDEQRAVRVMGPNGQWLFPTLTPESIQGNLDYRIDVASSTQTETVMKEQATMLFQTLAPALPQAVPKLAADLLEAFGKKDVMPYLMGTPDLALMGLAQQSQQTGGVVVPFPVPGEHGIMQQQQEQQASGGGEPGGSV